MVLAAATLVNDGAPILVMEPNATRAAVARRLGATVVVPDAGRAGDALDTELDVVFDCSGTADAAGQIAALLAPGGELILVGVLELGRAYPLPGRHWVWRELDCRGSSGYGAADFSDALAAIAGAKVDLIPIVGGQRPLTEAELAFAELARPAAPAKLLLLP